MGPVVGSDVGGCAGARIGKRLTRRSSPGEEPRTMLIDESPSSEDWSRNSWQPAASSGHETTLVVSSLSSSSMRACEAPVFTQVSEIVGSVAQLARIQGEGECQRAILAGLTGCRDGLVNDHVAVRFAQLGANLDYSCLWRLWVPVGPSHSQILCLVVQSAESRILKCLGQAATQRDDRLGAIDLLRPAMWCAWVVDDVGRGQRQCGDSFVEAIAEPAGIESCRARVALRIAAARRRTQRAVARRCAAERDGVDTKPEIAVPNVCTRLSLSFVHSRSSGPG